MVKLIKYSAWIYGINSTDLMTDLYHKGVHTLVTDRPDLGKQFKSSLNIEK